MRAFSLSIVCVLASLAMACGGTTVPGSGNGNGNGGNNANGGNNGNNNGGGQSTGTPETVSTGPHAASSSVTTPLASSSAYNASSSATTGPGSNSSSTGEPSTCVPTQHVAQPSACGSVTGYPADAGPVSCTTSADCPDAGVPAGTGITGYTCLHGTCSLSTCESNDDCGDGGVCSCAGSTFGYSHVSPGNICVPGNCRSDSDCGPGGYCSPSYGSGGPFYGVQGYYCHACRDACLNDSDCGDASGCSYCAFDPTVGSWACSHSCYAG